jgi:hypothetical protein
MTVGILHHALRALRTARADPSLRLLGQTNLILLGILRLRLRLRWGRRAAAGGILRWEPWYRKNDQKKKRIHVASKTLAMMHEPESLHYLPPFGDENAFAVLLSIRAFLPLLYPAQEQRVQLFLSHSTKEGKTK